MEVKARSLTSVFLSFLFVSVEVFAATNYSGYVGEEVTFLLQDQWVKVNNDTTASKSSPSFAQRILPAPAWKKMVVEANRIIHANARLIGLSSRANIQLSSKVKSGEVESLRYKRFQLVDVEPGKQEEVEVKGGDLLVHFHKEALSHVNSNVTKAFVPGAFPVEFSKQEALERAKALHASAAQTIGKPKLVLLTSSQEEDALAYEVKLVDREDVLRSASYYIDAGDGSFLYSTPMAQTIDELSHRHGRKGEYHRERTPRTRAVIAAFGDNRRDFGSLERLGLSGLNLEHGFPIVYSEVGCAPETLGRRISFTNANAAVTPEACQDFHQNVAPDRKEKVATSARAAWENIGIFHDFFDVFFARKSLDDESGTFRILVQLGENFNNAFWNSELRAMAFGGGDSHRFRDFAGSLEVGSHESVHGIISYTSNLEYVGESGALNESYADVFGKLVAIYAKGFTDWKFGRDIFIRQQTAGAEDAPGISFIRDMKEPRVGHTNHMRFRGEVCSRSNDNCGVHINSGIANRAAVLMLERMNAENFIQIYYLTLTQFLQPRTTFREMRQKTLVACEMLLGEADSECGIMAESFSAVGIDGV